MKGESCSDQQYVMYFSISHEFYDLFKIIFALWCSLCASKSWVKQENGTSKIILKFSCHLQSSSSAHLIQFQSTVHNILQNEEDFDPLVRLNFFRIRIQSKHILSYIKWTERDEMSTFCGIDDEGALDEIEWLIYFFSISNNLRVEFCKLISIQSIIKMQRV